MDEIRQKLVARKGGIEKEKQTLQAMEQSMPEMSEQVQQQGRASAQREYILSRIVTDITQKQQNGQFPTGQNMNGGMPRNAM